MYRTSQEMPHFFLNLLHFDEGPETYSMAEGSWPKCSIEQTSIFR